MIDDLDVREFEGRHGDNLEQHYPIRLVYEAMRWSIVALTFVTACGSTETSSVGTNTIAVVMNGVPTLSEGAYEGWLIYGDEKVSTGVFTSGDAATMTTDRDPNTADKFVITVEPVPDTDLGPSGVILLLADTPRDSARLSFPVDLTPGSGGFILATPTDDDPTNEQAGVWFANVPGPVPGLSVAELPPGWVYEGWAVTQGVALTTGRFREVDRQDPNFYTGAKPGPNVPGEDYVRDLPDSITPPVDLANGSTAIVIAVVPDIGGVDPTGIRPFPIRLLAAGIPADLPPHRFVRLGIGPTPEIGGRVTFTTAAQ